MEADLSRDILSLTEFRDHLTQKIDALERDEGVMVVTRSGRPAAIVLAPKAYEKLRYHAFLRAKVAAGLADVARGRTSPHAEVMRRAKARLRRSARK